MHPIGEGGGAAWASLYIYVLCVDHNMEIFSALLPTTWKNGQRFWQQRGKVFEFDYLHEFETICEFTLGFQSGA
jgi:hypothetical protein